VRLLFGEDVRLAAFVLNTHLQGQLRLRQQGALPAVHGQVNLINGTFRAYGQDLQIRTGKLSFNGPVDQPLMAIEAIRNPEKTEDDVIAITGTSVEETHNKNTTNRKSCIFRRFMELVP
jgi:translocation and assembly module TamB